MTPVHENVTTTRIPTARSHSHLGVDAILDRIMHNTV